MGSAPARSARWNRVDGYLALAEDHWSVTVQVETAAALEAAGEIASVDGVVTGPSDLVALMGLLGQQTHPDVVAVVRRAPSAVSVSGKPVGVNAFDPVAAKRCVDEGSSFILADADVGLLARGSESLALTWRPADAGSAVGRPTDPVHVPPTRAADPDPAW